MGHKLPLFASAMRRQDAKTDLEKLGDRPTALSSGLADLDHALGGGFPVGGVTLIAGKARSGSYSMMLGTALQTMGGGNNVSAFSERLNTAQIRGRMVVLASKVNGFRFQAGFATAADRMALEQARSQILWRHLVVEHRRQVSVQDVDEHLFAYRPWLVLLDALPRSPLRSPASSSVQSLVEGLARYASLARKHRVAVLWRYNLRANAPIIGPEALPGYASLKEHLAATVVLDRRTGTASPTETYRGGQPSPAQEPSDLGEVSVTAFRHDLGAAGQVLLRFDPRFAGLEAIP